MQKIILVFVLVFSFGLAKAQQITPEQYIETYKQLAISEMNRSGVPASITLAQGLLETESGNSMLVKKSNNHFGIKCKSNWTGESVSHDDDARGECFRKYGSAEESYIDHSNFLKNSARYAGLFSLDKTDYKGWAYGLKAAGYATNPQYPQILIRNIEKYNLNKYDLGDANTQATETILVKNTTTVASNKQEEKILQEAKANMPTQPVEKIEEVKIVSEAKDAGVKYNGIKAVYAEKGTSLLALATNNNIPLLKLLEYNDLKKDGLLDEAQYIYLEQKLQEGNEDFYISPKRQTLQSISQITGVQLKSLTLFNNLSEDIYIPIGKKIFLKKSVAGNSLASAF